MGRAWKRKSDSSAGQGEAKGGGERIGKRRASFSKMVADRLGVSKRTAERALKRSGVFSDEDREIFEQFEVSSVQQDAIASIADPARRGECLAAIVQGLDPGGRDRPVQVRLGGQRRSRVSVKAMPTRPR